MHVCIYVHMQATCICEVHVFSHSFVLLYAPRKYVPTLCWHIFVWMCTKCINVLFQASAAHRRLVSALTVMRISILKVASAQTVWQHMHLLATLKLILSAWYRTKRNQPIIKTVLKVLMLNRQKGGGAVPTDFHRLSVCYVYLVYQVKYV